MPNVQVAIRCRPKLDHESGIPSTKLEINEHNNSIAVLSQNNAKTFRFDKVFAESSTQQDVFDYVSPMVDNVLNGLHATVFAYGQTGSGKTFTMDGFNYAPPTTGPKGETSAPKPRADTPAYQHGVVPRIIQLLFDRARERMGGDTAEEADTAESAANEQYGDGAGSTMRYKLKCSFMQLYNEKISDLLNPTSTKNSKEGLKIRWTRNDQFAVENLYVFECDSPDQMREMFMAGIKEKVMGSHHMNLQSSRSHSLFTIHVHSWDSNAPDLVRKSELTLVDLAGSEKLHLLSQNPSQQLLKESIEINTSLLALGKVITALATNSKQHVPYRDSKLTKLLKHALGGNSVTTMIACCNPLDPYVEETSSTLLYASRARNITNDPRVNENPQSALIRSLREEITSLKMELEYYRQLVATGVVDDNLAKRLANRMDKEDSSNGGGGGNNNKNRLALGESPDPRKGNGAVDSLTISDGNTPSQKNRLVSSSSTDGNANNGGGGRSEIEVELAEKLTESCNILKSLMGVNAQLRLAFDRMKTAKEAIDKREMAVNAENTALRERIEMLESIAMNADGDDSDAEGSSSTQKRRSSGNNKSKDDGSDNDDDDNDYGDGNLGGSRQSSGLGSSQTRSSSQLHRGGGSGGVPAPQTMARPKPKTTAGGVPVKHSAAHQTAKRKPGPYAQRLQDYANKYRNPTRSIAYEDYYGRAAATTATGGIGSAGVGAASRFNAPGPAPAGAALHTKGFEISTAPVSVDAADRKSRELSSLLDKHNSKLPRRALEMVPKSLQDQNQFGALSFGGATNEVKAMEERRRERQERLARLQQQNMQLMGAAPPPLVMNFENVPNAHLMVMNGVGSSSPSRHTIEGLGGAVGGAVGARPPQQQQPNFGQLLGAGGRNQPQEDRGSNLNFGGGSGSGGVGSDRILRPSSSSSRITNAAGGGSGGTLNASQTNAEKLFAYLSNDEMQGAFTAEQLAKLRSRGGNNGGSNPTLSSTSASNVAPLSADPSVYGLINNKGGVSSGGSTRGANSAPSTPNNGSGLNNSGRLAGGGSRGTYSTAIPEPMSMARGGGGSRNVAAGGGGGQQQARTPTHVSSQRMANGSVAGGSGGHQPNYGGYTSSSTYLNNVSTPRSKSSYEMMGYSGDRTNVNARPTIGSLGALGVGTALSFGGGNTASNNFAPTYAGGNNNTTNANTIQPRAPPPHEAMHRREQQQNEQLRYQQQIYEAQQALLAQQQKLAQRRM